MENDLNRVRVIKKIYKLMKNTDKDNDMQMNSDKLK